MKKPVSCVLLAFVSAVLVSVPALAFNQPCAVAPYEVNVTYTPIQPQPAEATYCACLAYGCPDGAPVIAQNSACSACSSCLGYAPCAPCAPTGCLSSAGGVGTCLVQSAGCGVTKTAADLVCDAGCLVKNAVDNVFCAAGSVLGCLCGNSERTSSSTIE